MKYENLRNIKKAMSNSPRLLLPVALLPSCALAEPASIKAGPLELTPQVALETYHDDNFLRSSDAAISSMVTKVSPQVEAMLSSNSTTLSAKYAVDDFAYSASSSDDATDHVVDLSLGHEFYARNRVSVSAYYFDGHEERGKGLSQGSIASDIDVIEYTQDNLQIGYELGGLGANGRLALSFEQQNYEYQNERSLTRVRDREQQNLTATFYWDLGSKLELLAELRNTDNEYDYFNPESDLGTLDSEQTDYYLGAEWQATAKTTGAFRVGRYDRSYDSSARQDSSGNSWDAWVEWKPLERATVTLRTGRASRESTSVGNFIDAQDHSVNWVHQLSGRDSFTLNFAAGTDSYEGSEREEDRNTFSLSYERELNRWLKLAVGYRYGERDSSSDSNDYEQNIGFVRVNISL